MQLHVIARGKIGRSPEAELVERYARRISWGFKVTELPDRGGTFPPPAPTPCRVVALDERGLFGQGERQGHGLGVSIEGGGCRTLGRGRLHGWILAQQLGWAVQATPCLLVRHIGC